MNSNKLKRTIGLIPATSIGLGAMLGAGIFVFLGLAGGEAGFAAVISFLIGGVIALFTAACSAELATAMPQNGGGYFFISRAFGTFWGTLTGIAQWIGLIFACAFYLASFGDYTLAFLEELGVDWTGSTMIWSFCFTFIILVINIIGTKNVGNIQNIMVISLTVILVLIFTYGIIDFLGFENKPLAFSEVAPEGGLSVFTTTALIFTSYLGFVQIANIGAEIKNPGKNLPRSLIGSVIVATVLYTFIMVICVVTFPQEELKKFGETATIEVARAMLGNVGALVVLFAGLLATLSSANASMISASRSVFALGRDQLISKKASKINKRFSTPHIALILVALPVSIMLIKSNLEIFAEVASLMHLIIYAGICIAIIKLRRTRPVWYIPVFRVPFANIVAGLGALSCLVLVFFMQKNAILIGLGILLLVVAYYFFYVRKRKIQIPRPEPPHIDVQVFNPNILIPVDLNQDKKYIPQAVFSAIPGSRLLLLGFRESPEQSQPEQLEDEFGEEGKKKLEFIQSQLNKLEVDIDSKLMFTNKIASHIEEVIEDEDLQFILVPKPISALNQLVIPVYDVSQVGSKLSTIIYNINSYKPVKIKILLFIGSAGEPSGETRLKQAIESKLGLLGIRVDSYEVYEQEETSVKKVVEKKAKKTDLVLWAETEPSEYQQFMDLILEKESTGLSSPLMVLLNREKSQP